MSLVDQFTYRAIHHFPFGVEDTNALDTCWQPLEAPTISTGNWDRSALN